MFFAHNQFVSSFEIETIIVCFCRNDIDNLKFFELNKFLNKRVIKK